MERPVVVRHGEVVLRRLPPGFRFHPTDEELVVHYLRRRALSCPLPAAVIADLPGLHRLAPWNLPGAGEGDVYFFTTQPADNRKGGGGYWKATGKEKPVLQCASGRLVGVKRALVFRCSGCRTGWAMHEYRLAAGARQKRNCLIQPKEWVVCRVFQKSRSRMPDGETRQTPSSHTMQPSSLSPPSSSSCVTGSLGEEVCSSSKDAASASPC